jgi:hypothetical protein
MKRNTALKILNPVLAILLINQVLTGLFGHELSHEAFEIFHRKAALVLVAFVIVHVILNFNWIKVSYFKAKA